MAFRLPPLNALRIFEAAARHGSFRKAAEELNLTASAVSHGIQTLENWLGVELFHRAARGLRLTAAGEAYLPRVGQALGLLAQATDQIPGRSPTGALSLSSAPSFAGKVLLPRLAGFAARHPELHLTIDSSHRLVDLAIDGFDLAIRYSPTEKQAPNWTLLVAEEIVPVCSPELKRKLAGRTLATRLSQAPLIHVTSVSADWNHWSRVTGLVLPSIEDWLSVDTMQLAFDAAVRGLGIVLGRFPVISDDLAAGRLVTLGGEPIPSGSGYWLVTPQTDFLKPEVKLFRDWLIAELGVAAEFRTPPG